MDTNENKIKKISYDIDENIKYLEGLFENCGDIVKRKFPVGDNKEIWIYLFYLDYMTNR